MSKAGKLWLTTVIFVILLGTLSKVCHSFAVEPKATVEITREQQHIMAMEEGANPNIGVTAIQEDGRINEYFVSHLPLVIIDIGGQNIPITKKVTENGDIVYTGEDPYVHGRMDIIDGDNHVNSLQDEPIFSNDIQIKYRGNYSLSFDKKQYGIKLTDDAGNSVKYSILGMEENNDWILNVSNLDASLMRNYVAYNLGSAIFPGTPECKYCEVVIKDGSAYTYQGVYLMMEKIEKGKGRVELSSYAPGDTTVDYLLCRDRKDDTSIQLDTFGNQQGLTYGRISVLYPDSDVIDDLAINTIQNDIDRIDRMLYSPKGVLFNDLAELIDMESFVDYFLFNELMGNYDAGDNSTYMYKRASGKLCMGPVWDYDGAMDNNFDVANPEYFAFYESSWFEQLVKSKEFMTMAQNRYKELTENDGLLSNCYIESYIDGVADYLGNAALRDRSRWDASYSRITVDDDMDSSEYLVVRKSSSWEDEAERLGTYFVTKELYMNSEIKRLLDDAVSNNQFGALFAVATMVVFACVVTLIRRRGMYR